MAARQFTIGITRTCSDALLKVPESVCLPAHQLTYQLENNQAGPLRAAT